MVLSLVIIWVFDPVSTLHLVFYIALPLDIVWVFDNVSPLAFSNFSSFLYIYYDMVKVRYYIGHLSKHYDNPDLYLTSSLCKVYKQNSYLRFRSANYIDLDR